MIEFRQHGNFNKTEKFLSRAQKKEFYSALKEYGAKGVEALRQATPKDTGLTADSWDYEVIINDGRASIVWTNSNISNYVPVVILIQYGHASMSGGYVPGRDFINPAIKPIFQEITDGVWREVIK